MTSNSDSLLLTDLSYAEVREHLAQDRRLIVPIGACDQYGPHLPIGASTLLAEAFSNQLAHDCGVLLAPAVPYGVNVPSKVEYPGASTLREKTLHAFLNDLLACWEDDGFAEFILITVHDYDSHVEAIATVTGTNSRVRVLEVLNMDVSEILPNASAAQHGGEIVTSLMLHLYPERVRMERAVDYVVENRGSSLRRVPSIPVGSAGSLGRPSIATAELGRCLYDFIYAKIRARISMTGD
jgi:creatinine amidohydrolase